MINEAKIDILSLSLQELEKAIVDMGEAKFRAKQIYQWLTKGAWGAEMKNVPAHLQKKLDDVFEFRLPLVKKRLVSKIDGTIKYLFELIDGECIESVFMKYEHGNTLCISSQVGCRMGCKFCASTLLGRVRDLTPSEMLGQIISAQKDTGERISNVVMMGIGEPLDNYDNTIKFLHLVSSPDGLNIGLRHISLSTCGLVSGIEKLSNEGLPVTLSVSLHAYANDVRSEIMPINNKYPIEMLLDACNKYFEKTGRRISFEYTLINGKNDDTQGAVSLAKILKKHLHSTCHVNLIPLNEVKETRLETSKNINNFKNKLLSLGINATVRRRLGSDINASCGQLRRQAKEENK
ncbi:MAG: 23S rRNA (adenine(2503)-C(2))-methyltransferase RlmN [Clostridia bacterium]|nr:23S rRNA (adenine(2503)-C(2))-methyltransferase RlmN [Clostridia bacterium]MBQ7789510.1 23S rRNA (adenine(2503)-C(2))-methyltransferase RlmN [Clostridia bacterium]